EGDEEGGGPNQAPAAPGISGNSLQENNAAGAVVGTFSAVDPEGDDVAFSLASGGDNAFFTILGNELRAAGGFNFEVPQDQNGDNVYEIAVTATDDGTPNESSTANLTVTVTDDAADVGPSGQALCGGV